MVTLPSILSCNSLECKSSVHGYMKFQYACGSSCVDGFVVCPSFPKSTVAVVHMDVWEVHQAVIP